MIDKTPLFTQLVATARDITGAKKSRISRALSKQLPIVSTPYRDEAERHLLGHLKGLESRLGEKGQRMTLKELSRDLAAFFAPAPSPPSPDIRSPASVPGTGSSFGWNNPEISLRLRQILDK